MPNKVLSTILHTTVKTTIHVAGAATCAQLPALEVVVDLLDIVVELCERVPQNKHAARALANRCREMYWLLKQYEEVDLPDRVLKYRQNVFNCLETVRSTMAVWSNKSWFSMLIQQDEFEKEIELCNNKIQECFDTLTTATNFETLGFQKQTDKWRRDFMDSAEKDRTEIRKSFASVNLVQEAILRNVTENRNDVRKLVDNLQKHFADPTALTEERDRMASNLYDLLRLSHQLLPRLQLDSGEVEWEDRAPIHRYGAIGVYKGRYLKREDVTIKVIRTMDNDERNINRIRREVELWARIYETDKGKHILPFYGFCTTDGVHLALVSPWIENGDALEYVKKHDQLVNYKQLIRGIAEGIGALHSMDDPVIHGQLKAEKILIGDKAQPLITDFTLAKLEGNALTRTAGTSGAYRWCAPEICTETSLTSTKSDVYSFGMTILELLTHERPYAHIARSTVVIKRMEKGIPPDRPSDARAIERGLDDRMWRLLLSCWSFQPEDRPSIQELLERL
ncbi:Protein kinase-like domain containing protein [Amanita muscaria]